MNLLNVFVVRLVIVIHKNEIFHKVSMKFSNPNLKHCIRFVHSFLQQLLLLLLIICRFMHVLAPQVREQTDVLSTGLPVRTAISTAQAPRVRSIQRLSRYILRLV